MTHKLAILALHDNQSDPNPLLNAATEANSQPVDHHSSTSRDTMLIDDDFLPTASIWVLSQTCTAIPILTPRSSTKIAGKFILSQPLPPIP